MQQLHKKFTEELTNHVAAAGRNHLFLRLRLHPKQQQQRTTGRHREDKEQKQNATGE